jgi:DNA-3-methyladenine glycosylase I
MRCEWVPAGDELYVAYHDLEWGVPVHDERALFELLTQSDRKESRVAWLAPASVRIESWACSDHPSWLRW